MQFISQIPKLNNIQFVPTDIILPEQYNSLPFQKEWFSEHIQYYQRDVVYQQPIQLTDKHYVELHREGDNDVALKILDCNGDELYSLPAQFVIFQGGTGSVYQNQDGTTVPLSVHKWHFSFAELGLTAGEYYVSIPVEFYDGETPLGIRTWISEPLDVQQSHEDTIYIEVTNNSNKQDVIFQFDLSNGGYKGDYFFQPTFGLRVQGAFADPNKFSSANVWEKEQNYEQRNLNGAAWFVNQIVIGQEIGGVPPYMIDKINEYLVCDAIKVEGIQIVKDEGAEFETEQPTTFPLMTGRVDVRYFDKQDQYTDTRGSLILLFAEPVGFPYFVYKLSVAYGVQQGPQVWAQAKEIKDPLDRDSFVNYLNTVVKGSLNFNGQVIYQDNNFYYQNAGNDNYSSIPVSDNPTVTKNVVMTRRLAVGLNISAIGQTATVGIRNMSMGIVWGDATSEIKQQYDNATVFNNHIYSAVGIYEVALYTSDVDGDKSLISLNNNLMTGQYLQITGQCPTMLRSINCKNMDMGGAPFDLDIIANCRNYIREFVFYQCKIIEFASNIFSLYPWQSWVIENFNNWKQLSSIDIQGNNLDSTGVSAFLEDFYDYGHHVGKSGVISLKQSPAAPLIGGAIADKTNLVNAGWIVDSD